VHRLGPESCSQQVAPKASPTWPCGEVMAELHLAGWCLSGCTALLSELLRGGIGLLDSALVTCSLQKKKSQRIACCKPVHSPCIPCSIPVQCLCQNDGDLTSSASTSSQPMALTMAWLPFVGAVVPGGGGGGGLTTKPVHSPCIRCASPV
jgi:hypothetical protein